MTDLPSDPSLHLRCFDPGPHARHVDAYRGRLVLLGHRGLTLKQHVVAARHFCHWLHVSRGCLAEVTATDIVRFGRHKCRCIGHRRASWRGPFHSRYLVRVRKFVRFLVEIGVVKAPLEAPPEQAPEIIAWLDWLRRHRGLSAASVKNYERALEKLLPHIGTDPARYGAANLRLAYSDRCSREGQNAREWMATALRSWLGYNAGLGRCAPTLTTVLPPVARPRRDNAPRGLKAVDVNRLLASCDTDTAIGRRDFAVLLLLARLGLRAEDVRCLTFDQIDWRRGCLRVSGKGRRVAELPLPQEVGEAILAWLEDGRPPLDDPHVFLCMRRPWRPFSGGFAIGQIVVRALDRSELKNTPSRGAHLLRHSVAQNLVEDGATLETVATLLRHRSIVTTSIYAKTDPGRLREIAQPWPGGAS